MGNNTVDLTKRTKGEWFVSHSPARTSSVSGKVFKSIKTSKGIGGHIIANCFSTGPNSIMLNSEAVKEAEANAAFICKAVNNYDSLLENLKEMILVTNGLRLDSKYKQLLQDEIKAIEKAKAAIQKAEQ